MLWRRSLTEALAVESASAGAFYPITRILGDFVGRKLGQPGTDTAQHVRASLPLDHELLVHVGGDDGYHGPAGTFDDDGLPAIVYTLQQLTKSAAGLPSLDAFGHVALPSLVQVLMEV